MSITGHIVIKGGKLATWLSSGSYSTRGLSHAEWNLASSFFRGSVDLTKVRIAEKASGAGGRAFVAENTVYMGTHRKYLFPTTSDPYWVTFVHEMVHVWQYQVDGSDYALRALQAQMLGDRGISGGASGKNQLSSSSVGGKKLGYSNDAYDYAAPLVGGLKWSDFNPEAQAELVSDLWEKGYLNVGTTVTCVPRLVASAELYHFEKKTWRRIARDRSLRVEVFLACLRRGKGAALSDWPGVRLYVKWDKTGQIIDTYD